MSESSISDAEERRLQDLLASGEQLAQIGTWEWIPPARELYWSQNLYRIFGFEPGEVRPTLDLVMGMAHPADRERLARNLRDLADRDASKTVDFRIIRSNGERRYLKGTRTILELREDGTPRLVGVTQDLTDRRDADREISAHVALAEALVEWTTFEAGARGLLARLGAALECTAGIFWVPAGDVLEARVLWRLAAAEPPTDTTATPDPLRRGMGLAGRAWESGSPLGLTLAGTPAEPADVALSGEEPAAAVAVPALTRDEVLAVVELQADSEIRITDRMMRSLTGIAHELGYFLSRRGGELAGALLTAREIEMLQLAAQGLSGRETAERLTISPATVKTHLENIYRKLGVSDKPSAVANALRLGIID
ncbi:MAG: LuxR C-terminal-related transcriptional regulator [Solirubrobacteraceae bacterium]|nr:LuxR C-terminal-related transcriptional regulator [Solirubrobacteraceae bacterium]